MELNVECIRAVMICCEERTALYLNEQHTLAFIEMKLSDIKTDLDSRGYQFQPEEISYTVYKLIQANMLVGEISYGAHNTILRIVVTDLTWDGHEFARTIKNDTTWSHTKSKLTKIGVVSLQTVWELAKQYVQQNYLT